jgi:hypothetical protein
MRLSDAEKQAWRDRMVKDGFTELGPWLRWLANMQLKKRTSTA